MSKYTPGPWFVEGSDITNGYPDQGSRILIAEKVAIESDAHLIAAAPAMYEALQWAKQYLRMPNFHPDNSYGVEEWTSDYNKLQAALAQAEGRGGTRPW